MSESGTPARYEVLPFPKALSQAREVGRSLDLTVTNSPKHGPDHSLEIARELVAHGHRVSLHVAARMVSDRAHTETLLRGIHELGIEDMFLIGGDAPEPVGEFSSAAELLAIIDEHPLRPRLVGIGAYPEGHPLIDASVLDAELLAKGRRADYMVTQLCFDPAVLSAWLAHQRSQGVTLPLWVGMPGHVSPTKLLEISARIGVGPSLSFLRKQGTVRNLKGLLTARSGSAAENLLAAVDTLAREDGRVAGVHYFTFNELIETERFHREREPHGAPFIAVSPSSVA